MENSNHSNGDSHLYLEVTKQIVGLLENQKLTWDKPWISLSKDGKRPHNAVSGRAYSGLNQILLSMNQKSSGSPFNGWLTSKQIQDLGGRVLAGSKASTIYYYKLTYSDNMGRNHEQEQVLQMTLNEQQDLGLKKRFFLRIPPTNCIFPDPC